MDKIAIIRKGKSLSVSASECKYNTRIKLYPSGDDWLPVQVLCANDYIFNPNGCKVDKSASAPAVFSIDDGYVSQYDNSAQNLDRSIRRAKANLYDYIRCNVDMNYFVTLTFSSEFVNRSAYAECVRKFSQWCSNRVKRKGFKYVAVIERHKRSNGLHFHMLCNADVLNTIDSGTVKCTGRKKPIKVATADRFHVPIADRQTVYNISDWSYGFSTALQIVNDDRLVKTSHYLCKYLTKDFEKIGGRFYYNGGSLIRPKYEYCNLSFGDFESDYDFVIENTSKRFKVRKIDE